jgi:hypothetical protein
VAWSAASGECETSADRQRAGPVGAAACRPVRAAAARREVRLRAACRPARLPAAHRWVRLRRCTGRPGFGGSQVGEGSSGVQGGEVMCSAQASEASGGAQVGDAAAVPKSARAAAAWFSEARRSLQVRPHMPAGAGEEVAAAAGCSGQPARGATGQPA